MVGVIKGNLMRRVLMDLLSFLAILWHRHGMRARVCHHRIVLLVLIFLQGLWKLTKDDLAELRVSPMLKKKQEDVDQSSSSNSSGNVQPAQTTSTEIQQKSKSTRLREIFISFNSKLKSSASYLRGKVVFAMESLSSKVKEWESNATGWRKQVFALMVSFKDTIIDITNPTSTGIFSLFYSMANCCPTILISFLF